MLFPLSWHAVAEAALSLKGWVCGAESSGGVLVRVVACCSGPLFLRLATTGLRSQGRAWTT